MKDKVALITGSGSGIGRATALKLAERGCRIVGGDLNLAAAEATTQAVRQVGGEAIDVSLDVASRESVAAFVAEALRVFGRIDYMVNCAGIWEYATLVDLEESRWDRLIDINLKGTFLCCQAAAKEMLQQREGAIVNIASVAGRNGGNYSGAHYSASKGGVIAMTMQIAREIGSKGVRVNCVAPGPTDSPMTANWPGEIKAGLVTRTPLGRLGLPDDIAGAVVFLLSDDARFIVGETIEVNGGLFTH